MGEFVEIFKVQMPISSNVKNAPALVYNQDRSIKMMIPTTTIAQLMGDASKKYFYGHVDGDNFVCDREAEWQDW